MKKASQWSSIVAATGMVFFGATAHALSPGPIGSSFVNNGTSFDANFGNDSVSVTPFEDHYTFSAIPPMFGGGGLSVVSGFTLTGFNVRFDSLELWDVTSSSIVATGNIVAGDFLGFANFLSLVSGNDYDIIVAGELNSGFSSGSYSGNISIAPIPEPETYAMLLAGLLFVGFAARWRQASDQQACAV
jgi:hypothetical protein